MDFCGFLRLQKLRKLPNEPIFKKSKPLQTQGFLIVHRLQAPKNEPISYRAAALAKADSYRAVALAKADRPLNRTKMT